MSTESILSTSYYSLLRSQERVPSYQSNSKNTGTFELSEEKPTRLGGSKTGDGPSPSQSQSVDFHRMSSRQLMQWINTEIAEGRMTLDESCKYVTMTINGMPVSSNGDPLSQSDSWRDVPRDYYADLTMGIAGSRARGDEAEAAILEAMMARLDRDSKT